MHSAGNKSSRSVLGPGIDALLGMELFKRATFSWPVISSANWNEFLGKENPQFSHRKIPRAERLPFHKDSTGSRYNDKLSNPYSVQSHGPLHDSW